MKYLLSILLIIINTSLFFSQNNLTYNHTQNFEDIKGKKLVKSIELWLSQQTNLSNIQYIDGVGFTANGFVDYTNNIKYEDSENLSRVYAKQTNGKIVYKLNVKVDDNKVDFTISEVMHKPNSSSSNISYGFITSSNDSPAMLAEDYGKQYCDAVWKDLQNRINQHVELFFAGLNEQLLLTNK